MSQEPQEIQELQAMVAEFNQKFDQWTKTHNSRVTFGWMYGAGEKQVKALEILGVDKIVWRKPPPKGLGEMMNGLGKDAGSAPQGEIQPSK